MIAIDLTGNECLEFRFILPVQGSLKTLELVEHILKKAKVNDTDLEKLKKIDFEEIEIKFLKKMIAHLDKNQLIRFSSLSLIKKIMDIKGA
jgi:hypothetical protein